MKKAKIKDGAYLNLVTGLGDPTMDKTVQTRVKTTTPENYRELSGMMANDGIASRIANCVPESALKHDISIIGDNDGKYIKEAYAMGLFEAFIQAGIYSRLYGGALIVTLYENGGAFDTPISERAKVKGYKVFSCSRVNIDQRMFVKDANSPYFDDIEFFEIEKPDGEQVHIHASRVIVVKGSPIPDSLLGATDRQMYFGLSDVQKVSSQLKDYSAAMGGVVNMLLESDISIFSLTGLNEMLAMADNGIRKVHERMSVVKQGMSTMRAIFQDSNDRFDMISHNYNGIPEILKMIRSTISACTSIPVSILFGETVSGLSQSNEGDRRQYDECVSRWRNVILYKPMCKALSDLVARNCGSKNAIEFEWGPVSVMSETEKIDARKKQAEMMQMYYNMGVLTAEEIREAVFVNGSSFEVSVKG